MKLKTYKVGSWEIKYLPERDYISGALISKLEKFLNKKWLGAVRQFPCENLEERWGGLKKFQIPSPIIRVELSPLVLPKGNMEEYIYSIGKRPGLLGVLAEIARQFPEHRKLILEALGYKFSGIIQMGNFVQDDKLLAEGILRIPYFIDIPENIVDGQLYWIRTNPNEVYPEELIRKLESVSLVPVRADGCNSEFMALGMAERLSETSSKNLPWDTSFVVKLVQGTWGEGVEVYHIDDSKEEKAAARNRIENLVKTLEPDKLMIQPYIPDRIVERDGQIYHEIWRLYFVYLGLKIGYAFTGGMVQGSQSRKVSGIQDTYFIPIFEGMK